MAEDITLKKLNQLFKEVYSSALDELIYRSRGARGRAKSIKWDFENWVYEGHGSTNTKIRRYKGKKK